VAPEEFMAPFFSADRDDTFEVAAASAMKAP